MNLTLAQELEGMLWPERFPPGHERHDAEHSFWLGDTAVVNGCYQWDADTIEYVAEVISREVAKDLHGRLINREEQ